MSESLSYVFVLREHKAETAIEKIILIDVLSVMPSG